MATFKERVKELRIQRHYSQQQVADMMKVTKQTISQYERGVRRPDNEALVALSDIFNVSTDYLLGKENITPRLVDSEQLKLLDSPRSIRIPVLGYVAAGVPISAIEDVLDWEEIAPDVSLHGEFFGLKIKGDSMAPRIVEGDVVIVRCQNDAESGDVVIAQVNGDSATCKRLSKYAAGISLISFNPMYPPMNYTNEEIEKLPVTIIGKVIENRQKF